MNFKKSLLSLVLIVCLLASIGCTSTSNPESNDNGQAATNDVLKLAYVGPLTGNLMQYGTAQQNALKMLVDKTNANGGLAGKQVEIVFYDDKGDTKETVNLANKIISDPDIFAVIGSFTSSCSMAAAPIFEKAGMLQFAPSASHPDFPTLGEHMFTGAMTQRLEAAGFADIAVEDLGGKNIGIIAYNTDYGVQAVDFFTKRVEELGSNVVAYEKYIENQTSDFTPLISKVKSKNPDVFYVLGSYADVAKIFQQAKTLELDAQYMGNGLLIKQEFLDLMGENGEGITVMSSLPVFLSSVLDSEGVDSKLVEFVEEYKSMFGKEPDGFVSQAYEAASILFDGIDKVGLDTEKIQDYVSNLTDYEGIAGQLSYNENRELIRPIWVYEIKNGEFVAR